VPDRSAEAKGTAASMYFGQRVHFGAYWGGKSPKTAAAFLEEDVMFERAQSVLKPARVTRYQFAFITYMNTELTRRNCTRFNICVFEATFGNVPRRSRNLI
jgi:hypothetical protein